MTRKSVVMVSVQLLCIALLIATGPVIPSQLPGLIVFCAGIAIIVWAVAVMRFFNLRIEPEVAKTARLVTGGPYRVIRHPMYTGGILILLAWLWNDFTLLRLVIGVVLIGDFFVKLNYEEELLRARFPEYTDDTRRTKRLVPFIY